MQEKALWFVLSVPPASFCLMCLSSWARGDIKQLLCIYFLRAGMIPSHSESPPKASLPLSTDHGYWAELTTSAWSGKTKSIFLLWVLMDVAVTKYHNPLQ